MLLPLLLYSYIGCLPRSPPIPNSDSFVFQFDSNLTQSWSPHQSMPPTPTSPPSPMSAGEYEILPRSVEKPEHAASSKATKIS